MMATEAEEIDKYRAAAVVQLPVKKNNVGWTSSEEFFVRNVSWMISESASASLENIMFCLTCNEETDDFSINAEIQVSILGTKLQTTGIRRFKSILPSKRDWNWHLLMSELPDVEELTFELKLRADEPEGIQFEPPKKRLKVALQPVESAAQDDDLLSLLNSGMLSDVTFVVAKDGTRVKAHKLILMARSQIFARMLTCDMKEARNGEIQIHDMGAPALKILLRYIYSGQLEFPKEVKVDMDLCTELINAADKYGLENLKEYAAMALTEFVSIENASKLLKFVKFHKAEAATKALRSYFVRNAGKIADTL